MFSLFTKSTMPEFTQSSIDVSAVDHSFELLRSTAASVSTVAVEAAKVLQEQLEDSEYRFFQTIDSIEDLVLIKDREGRWKTLNKYGKHIFHFHDYEYLNKTDLELIELYPDLKKTLEKYSANDKEVWESGVASRFEIKIPCETGICYFDIIKTPTYDEGIPKELIIIGRDITETHMRSKREKACFNALNSVSDIIVILDSDFNIFFCNDQFVSKFQLEDYQQAVGKQLTSIIDITDFDYICNEVQNNRVMTFMYPKINQNITIVPMMNGQPKPIYYICTFRVV